MRKTRIKKTGEQIGELAKRDAWDNWVDTPAEALLNTVLAIRQKWKNKCN